MKGFRVGVLDADITGPDIPKLLGIEDQKLMQGPEGIEPADAGGIKAASMALILSSRDSPVVWRGPMKMAAIKQFIQDVNWGDLDFLIIDLPPGTSDEPLSVLQLIPDLAGAIIVTTPQEVALLDSRKAVNMVKAMKLPVLGIVENMSGLNVPTARRPSTYSAAVAAREWQRKWMCHSWVPYPSTRGLRSGRQRPDLCGVQDPGRRKLPPDCGRLLEMFN